MANTIMSAKNSFLDGLIMDSSPDNTQATCMTSALNATLLTLNGNEMSLLNDMGNGRVETAYLPEGYVPVGTCEFGDIIYIVSYNPIENQAQIGCFPSPERNLSTDEFLNTNQSLTNNDFIDENHNIINTSVKKILVDRKINPGDKYIIYSNEKGSIEQNSNKLSDYNEKKHGVNHKNVKLHVVSIEDSGKITYLDTTTKWYDNYYIKEGAVTVTNGKTDLDSYRDLVSSEWSIFGSKNSGKLAILAELEIIDSFSCSYYITRAEKINDFYEYDIVLEPTCSSSKGLTPSYLIIDNMTNSSRLVIPSLQKDYAFDWQTLDSYQGITMTFKIPYNVDGLGNRIQEASNIISFDVIPAMSFGKLKSMKATINIDFNKIGTGEITLDTWKYHNSASAITLQYGLSMYLLPNETIDYVKIKIYDNQGIVGEYLVDDRKSYNGIITEYIGLDGSNVNKNFSKYLKTLISKTEEQQGEQIIRKNGKYQETLITSHLGLELELTLDEYNEFKEKLRKDTPISELLDEVIKLYYLSSGGKYYLNDAGTLYSNFLYLAKIFVKKTNGEEIHIADRWLWTTNMFNEYYYKINDFKILKPNFVLDNLAIFEAVPQKYSWQETVIDNLGKDLSSRINTYSANIQNIGYDEVPNINMYIYPGLQNNYGCFSLSEDTLNKFDVRIKLAEGLLERSYSGYKFSQKETNISELDFLSIENIVLETDTLQNNKYINLTSSINVPNIKLNDEFKISIPNDILLDGWSYNDSEKLYSGTLDKCFITINKTNKENQSIPLLLQASIFNKAYTEEEVTVNVELPIYKPIIDNIDDLGKLGIKNVIIGSNNNKNIKLGLDAIVLNCNEERNYLLGGYMEANEGSNLIYESVKNWSTSKCITPARGKVFDSRNNIDFIEKLWNLHLENLKTFFNVYQFGEDNIDYIGAKSSSGNNLQLNKSWIDNIRRNISTSENGYVKSLYNHPNWTNFTMAFYPYQNGWAYASDGTGSLGNMDNKNLITILGARCGDGMTMFNQAHPDTTNNDRNIINQDAYNRGTTSITRFPNFAYLLYLILSRVYHKNKLGDPKLQKAKNHVRPLDHTTSIIKNIITEVSPNSSDYDIVFHNVSFNSYVSEVLNSSSTSDLELKKSAEIGFLGTSKENVLSITIENSKIEFPDLSNIAMFTYMGDENVCEEIKDNKFYLYYNGEFKPYEDKELIFSESDIKLLNKHIFEEELPLYNIYKKFVESADTLILKTLTLVVGSYLLEISKYSYNSYADSGWNAYMTKRNDNYYYDPYLGGNELRQYYTLATGYYDHRQIIDNLYYNNNSGTSHKFLYTLLTEGCIYVTYSTHPGEEQIDIDSLYVKRFGSSEAYTNYKNSGGALTAYAIANMLAKYNLLIDLCHYNMGGSTWHDDWSFSNGVFQDSIYLNKAHEELITFKPNLNMSNNFKYENELIINANKAHEIFGVCLDPLTVGDNYTSPISQPRGIFGGFRDMSTDSTYEFISRQ